MTTIPPKDDVDGVTALTYLRALASNGDYPLPDNGTQYLFEGRPVVADSAGIENAIVALTASLDRERVLEEALLNVRALITEAAMTGFNYKDGDWAERLFASQQVTSAALAATSSPDALNGWQQIETAPTDATWVLVRVPVERFSPNYRIVHAHWAYGGGDDQPAFGPDWFYDTGYGFHNVSPKPTQWMPFDPPSPAPQTETRREG